MKRCLVLLSLVLAVGLCASVQAATFTGKVISVTDGDTLTVLSGKSSVKVRLDGIDAPELKQDFGENARAALVGLALKKTVLVSIRVREKKAASIATVSLLDGLNLSQEMLRRGLAWWNLTDTPKDEALHKLEQTASLAGIGLWWNSKAIPPWEFRKGPAKKKLMPWRPVVQQRESPAAPPREYLITDCGWKVIPGHGAFAPSAYIDGVFQNTSRKKMGSVFISGSLFDPTTGEKIDDLIDHTDNLFPGDKWRFTLVKRSSRYTGNQTFRVDEVKIFYADQ